MSKFYIKCTNLILHASVVIIKVDPDKFPVWDKYPNKNPLLLNIFEAKQLVEHSRKLDAKYAVDNWTYTLIPAKDNKWIKPHLQ